MPGFITVESGEDVEIDYYFDAFGDSIFAPEVTDEKQDDVAALYAGGAVDGIVQGNDIEELIRYLENT